MYSLFFADDIWRSSLSQDRFYWGIERENSDRSFSYTKCIGTVGISFFVFFQSLIFTWFSALFSKVVQFLIAESWQVVSFTMKSEAFTAESEHF